MAGEMMEVVGAEGGASGRKGAESISKEISSKGVRKGREGTRRG